MHKHKTKRIEPPEPIVSITGPSDAEWEALAGALDYDPDAALKAFDDATGKPSASTAGETRTRHTTIRIPADVLNAFRAEADRRGIGYQTLIVEALRIAAAKWCSNTEGRGGREEPFPLPA